MLETIPDILDFKKLKEIENLLPKVAFQDGKKTAGFRAVRVKNNQQAVSSDEARKRIDELVISSLREHTSFQRLAFPKTIQKPLISRYTKGMKYGLHVDDALMGKGVRTRTDISITVFLNQPTEYEGGVLEMHSPFGLEEIKLPAGACVLYPSNTLHQVTEVTSGERRVAVTWAQSFYPNPAHREILADLNRVRLHLHKIEPDGEHTDTAFKTYTNLMRMWADV